MVPVLALASSLWPTLVARPYSGSRQQVANSVPFNWQPTRSSEAGVSTNCLHWTGPAPSRAPGMRARKKARPSFAANRDLPAE
jgi:hypothetical protein